MVICEFVVVLAGHGISGKPLFSLPMSRHFELLYNTGIQLLHCCKPLPAFDCLVEAVKVYSSNPRLWLRLSECCVMANKKVSVNCLLGLCLYILCLFIASRWCLFIAPLLCLFIALLLCLFIASIWCLFIAPLLCLQLLLSCLFIATRLCLFIASILSALSLWAVGVVCSAQS